MVKKTVYAHGKHPNTLANLIHQGRPTSEELYGEPKKKRTLTVTESGWQGLVEASKATGCNSVSEFLELIGRQPAQFTELLVEDRETQLA